MDDDLDLDAQWTPTARDRYAASAAALIAAIEKHVAANLTRSGRQRELGPYFASANDLQSITEAFNEAEFEWCGSFPLALRGGEDDWDDEDEEFEEEDETGDLLSVVGRWDFRVTDPDAFVAAGRRAYAQTWPDDTDEDAEIAVSTLHNAVSELLHGQGLAPIEAAPGAQIAQSWVDSFVHDGSATDEDDPFSIARAPDA